MLSHLGFVTRAFPRMPGLFGRCLSVGLRLLFPWDWIPLLRPFLRNTAEAELCAAACTPPGDTDLGASHSQRGRLSSSDYGKFCQICFAINNMRVCVCVLHVCMCVCVRVGRGVTLCVQFVNILFLIH